MNHPNAPNPGGQSVPNQDQMVIGNMPQGGGNDEWRTDTYRNKGTVHNMLTRYPLRESTFSTRVPNFASAVP